VHRRDCGTASLLGPHCSFLRGLRVLRG
jgi:hypothetical protein